MNDSSKQVLKLLLSQRDYVTINEMVELTGLSDRSIRYAVEELNEWLTLNNLPEVVLDRNQGLIMNFSDELRQRALETLRHDESQDSYVGSNKRYIQMILILLTKSKKVSVKSLMDFFSISKTTVRRDIKKVKSFLGGNNLSLLYESKAGYFIKGKEINKRTMFLEICFRFVNFSNLFVKNEKIFHSGTAKLVIDYLDYENLLKTKHILTDINKKHQCFLNEFALSQLVICIVMQNKRVASGKHIVNKDNIILSRDFKVSPLFEDIINEILPSIKELPNEKYYLFQMLSTINILKKEKNIRTDIWLETQLCMLEMLSFMENNLEMKFNLDTEIIESFYQHLNAMLIRIESDAAVYNPLTTVIKHRYEDVFCLLKQSVKKIEEKYGKKVSDNEIAFLVMYFQALIDKQHKEIGKMQVAIVCGQGLVAGKLLESSLLDFFDFNVVAVLGSNEVELLEKIPLDLAITTVKLTGVTIPQVQVSPLLTAADIKKINEFLVHVKPEARNNKNSQTEFFKNIAILAQKHSTRINLEQFSLELEDLFRQEGIQIERRLFQPMLKNIISEDYIQLNVDVRDWKEAINIAAQPLYEKGDVEERYIQSMITSVEKLGPYIVIDEHIALAHARPEDGAKRIGISFMTIPKGVMFDSEYDPVKLLICLSAIDNVSHLKLLSNLAEIISNKELVEKMVVTKNKKDFISLLLDFENNLEVEQ